MVLLSTCLRPRPWRNCSVKNTYCDAMKTITHKAELLKQERAVSSPTCSVLMHALMSLSVFSHSDIRVPVSAFIPCRSEICKQKNTRRKRGSSLKWVFAHSCVSVCWPPPVSVWGEKAESGGKSGGTPAAWEVWGLERTWKAREIRQCQHKGKNNLAIYMKILL